MAEAAAESLAARIDHRRMGRRPGQRLDHPSRLRDAERQREGAGAQSRRVLPRRAAGARVRPGRQPGPGLGRPGRRLRVAGIQSRHPRRLQGQRLDRRQRRQGRAGPEVHQGRQVPDAGRPLRQERRQQRSRELRPRRQDLGRPEDQRGLYRRRLSEQARRRAGRGYRQDEALLGRVRQQAGRRRPGKYDPKAPPAQQFRNPVHCVERTNDGLVYVCDRQADRSRYSRPTASS